MTSPSEEKEYTLLSVQKKKRKYTRKVQEKTQGRITDIAGRKKKIIYRKTNGNKNFVKLAI